MNSGLLQHTVGKFVISHQAFTSFTLTDTKYTFYSNKLQIPAFQLYSKICIIDNLSTIHLALGIFLIAHLDWFITDRNTGTESAGIQCSV